MFNPTLNKHASVYKRILDLKWNNKKCYYQHYFNKYIIQLAVMGSSIEFIHTIHFSDKTNTRWENVRENMGIMGYFSQNMGEIWVLWELLGNWVNWVQGGVIVTQLQLWNFSQLHAGDLEQW